MWDSNAINLTGFKKEAGRGTHEYKLACPFKLLKFS